MHLSKYCYKSLYSIVCHIVNFSSCLYEIYGLRIDGGTLEHICYYKDISHYTYNLLKFWNFWLRQLDEKKNQSRRKRILKVHVHALRGWYLLQILALSIKWEKKILKKKIEILKKTLPSLILYYFVSYLLRLVKPELS